LFVVGSRFDYVAEDPVEISFKAGDFLDQIEDEDEQGWCMGRTANGDEGLFPANYVEPVSRTSA
jgi:hypothetical protein